MRYEERVTYRTTPSGGQEIITESVPVYNKAEKLLNNVRSHKHIGTGKKKNGLPKIPFVIKHPQISLVILGIFVVFTVYMIASADVYLDSLITQYSSLTTHNTNSKYSFDKRLQFVSVDENGVAKITFGYKSEIAQEEAEVALSEAQAGILGGNPGVQLETSADAKLVEEALQFIAKEGKNGKYGIELYEAFFKDGTVEQYGAVFDKIVTEGKAPPELAIGVIANLAIEGTVARYQGDEKVILTRSDFISKSTNGKGIGLQQWSYWSHKRFLLVAYLTNGVFNDDGSINMNKAVETELDLIYDVLLEGKYCTGKVGITTPSTLDQDIKDAVWKDGDGEKHYIKESTKYNYGDALFKRGLYNKHQREILQLLRKNDTAQVTAGEWAEFWCDYMEKAGASCEAKDGHPTMLYSLGESGYGTTCKTRSELADAIVDYINNKGGKQ